MSWWNFWKNKEPKDLPPLAAPTDPETPKEAAAAKAEAAAFAAAAPATPKPPPEPPDPDKELSKHICFAVHSDGWIGVYVPSTVAGDKEIFRMSIEPAARLITHLERAILAVLVMRGECDELLEDDEPEPKKDEDCGSGDKP
jgi:hypothetical protein